MTRSQPRDANEGDWVAREVTVIELGQYNTLRIIRQARAGLYLGDASEEEVLLPNKYCPKRFKINDQIKVFVYLDHEERKIATSLTPKILLHEFALLQVTAVSEVGAFLDWGLGKDLFVPYKEQKPRMKKGKWYIVYLNLDIKTKRLFASNKIEKYLHHEPTTIKEKQEVALLVLKKTDMGYTAIVNNRYSGLLYNNEIFRELNIGEKLSGFVKKIRADNKVDVSLQAIGYKNVIDKNSEVIYRALVENKGFLEVTDNSSPDEIYVKFGISKKAFKKTLGALLKQKKIKLEPSGIKLI